MKTLFLFLITVFVIFLSTPCIAQDLTSDEILKKLRISAETLIDADFLLFAKITSSKENLEVDLEMEVQLLPEVGVFKASFINPIHLDGNFVAYDNGAVYHYFFLTNQMIVLDAKDPNAFNYALSETKDPMLLEDTNTQEPREFDMGPNEFFNFLFDKQLEITVIGYEESPLGKVYKLKLYNFAYVVLQRNVIRYSS